MSEFLKFVKAEADYNIAKAQITSGVEVKNIDSLKKAFEAAKETLNKTGYIFVGDSTPKDSPALVQVVVPSVLPEKEVEKKTTPTK